LTPKLLEELNSGTIDAAILALPIAEPTLQETLLFSEDFVLVRPAEDHNLPIPDGDALQKMRLLLLEEGHCFRDQALAFCNVPSKLPRDGLDGSSLTTLVQMVSAGIGVTLIPEMAIPIETPAAQVSIARFPAPCPSRKIGMVWRKNNPLGSRRAKLAKQYLALWPLCDHIHEIECREAHMITRRKLLTQGAASAALLCAPKFALANVALGTAKLSTVSDGSLSLPGNFVTANLPAEASEIISTYGLDAPQYTPECNVTLYQDGTNTVLFDVGSGPDFMPNAGTLFDSLDAAGVAIEDVTHVVFTHAHPDHIWGLIDDFDELVFPEASYHMGSAEWDYWWNPETVNTIGEARATFAVGAKRRLEFLEDRINFFNDGDEILSGISAVAAYGHTPGHMGFELRNGSDSALIVGDAIGNHHVAFHHPEWVSGSDQDGDTGVTSRKMLLDRLASEKMSVIGFHLPGGGMGHVEAQSDGSYRFAPLA